MITNVGMNRRGPSFFIMQAVFLFAFMWAAELKALQPNLPELPKPPYSVEQLRAWHKKMEPWPWLGLPEQKVKLRNRKDYELLLAIAGYARGGTFILFAKREGKWVRISDEIEQAHHPPNVLKTKYEGWHDFETFVPLWGSGGKEVLVSVYRWNGKKYIRKKSATGMWCDYEPFKSNLELCRSTNQSLQ